jgi:hypothetical protein
LLQIEVGEVDQSLLDCLGAIDFLGLEQNVTDIRGAHIAALAAEEIDMRREAI